MKGARIGDLLRWRENRDLGFMTVVVLDVDQPWITGGSKIPLAPGGVLVREWADEAAQPFVAPPFTLRYEAGCKPSKAEQSKRTAKEDARRSWPAKQRKVKREAEAMRMSAAEVLASFPLLSEENLRHFQIGPKVALAAGSTSRRGTFEHALVAMNPSEAWMFALLSELEIKFDYEVRSFTLPGGKSGQSFRPDLFIPEIDRYVELTVAEEWVAKTKRWRIRTAREHHPEQSFTLVQAQDFIEIAAGELSRECVLSYLASGTVLDRGERATCYRTSDFDPAISRQAHLKAMSFEAAQAAQQDELDERAAAAQWWADVVSSPVPALLLA